MKSLFLSLAGVALFIILGGILTRNYFNNVNESGVNRFEGLQKKIVYIGSLRLYVDVANTDELRTRGLSVRSKIGDDEGMFFVFNEKNVKPGIWMKNMEFPIDIIWIKDEKILQITKNVLVPPKGTPEAKLKVYYPNLPIDYILEVNGGYCDKNVVLEGSNIDITHVFIK